MSPQYTYVVGGPTGAQVAPPPGTYTAVLEADNAVGPGPASIATGPFTVTAPPAGSSVAPLVVPAVGGSGASLRTVGSATRLRLAGVAVWGITDFISTAGGVAPNQHTNRVAVCNAIAAIGGNVIRLRVLGDEYSHNTYLSQATYIQWVKDWRDAAKAAGLYVMICAWDSLDSQHGWNDGNWPANYTNVFPMFTAIYNALKLSDGSNDPYVFYEPFNEPNGVTTAQWVTTMQGTIAQFRTLGFQGLLVLDTTQWSHTYDDTSFSALEAYDAARTTSGKHNLAFARHDYTDDYGNNWNPTTWINATGGTATAHVIMETEFGNQNGNNQNDAFGVAETTYYKTHMFDRSNIAGGTAFLWDWTDKNTITTVLTTNITSPWGTAVVNWLSGVHPVSPTGTIAPLVVPAVGGSGASLRTTGSSSRLKLSGVAVWGIPDGSSGTSNPDFSAVQHTNRTAICARIKALGGNVMRIRVYADEYIKQTKSSSATQIQWVKDWRDACVAAGIYLQVCWWDALEEHNDWNPSYTFPMMHDVYMALKINGGSDDPSVYYEPWNEPNGADYAGTSDTAWTKWLVNMKQTVDYWRTTLGYQGFMIYDTTGWSGKYSETPMSQLEAYDASKTASGQHNIAFAYHNYSGSTSQAWSSSSWIGSTGGTSTAHVIVETEFGNYNGSGTTSTSWASGCTAYFKTNLYSRSNIGGAQAFLFGNWYDGNAISSDAVGNNLTTWGNDVANWLSGSGGG